MFYGDLQCAWTRVYLHGMPLYIHCLDTPDNNQHLKVLICVGGRGV